ncbi:hypothetical protein EDD85DRAFT_850823 [Armillaria nabsnona]|nr:hypothetical protein EDD85DRAFT_850823 [Armillaria nabsnona]
MYMPFHSLFLFLYVTMLHLSRFKKTYFSTSSYVVNVAVVGPASGSVVVQSLVALS